MEFHGMQCAARRLAVPVIAALTLGFAGAAPVANPAAPIAVAAGHPSRHHIRAEASSLRDGQAEHWTLDVDGTTRLEQACQADLCQGAWFDGSRSFAFGINGMALPQAGDDDRAQRTFAAITSTAFAEPEFLSSGGRVSPRAGSVGALRYRVTAPAADELVVVADAQTQRLTGVERPDGSSYARLIRSGTPPAVVFGTRQYDRVSVVDSALVRPAGAGVQVGETREIALRAGPLPIVPCRLADREAGCLIDTGTTPSAVTLAFAERIGREPHGTIAIRGLGSYLTGVVDAGRLEIGSAVIAGLHFAVIPKTLGVGFDIILGSDTLAKLRIDIEPRLRRAWIGASPSRPEEPSRLSAAEADIDVAFHDGLPFAEVRLERRDPEATLIDTGDTETVSIGYDEYRRDMALFAPRGHSVATGVGAAEMDALDGELASIDVGPAHLERVPISAVRGQHEAHLGYGFAARCGRLVLELGQGRIQCQKRRDEVNDDHASETTRSQTVPPPGGE